MWEQYERIIRDHGAIVLFSSQPFTGILLASNLKLYKQEIIWLKTRPTNVLNAKKMFMKWHENILIFYNKLPVFNPQMRTDGIFTGKKTQRMNTDRSKGTLGKTGEKKDYVHEGNNGLFYPKTVLEFSNVNIPSLHPTQKPIALCEYLIKTYTNENDLVLDNCAGSFTTSVACDNIKRNWICIEKERNYCEVGLNRVNKNRENLRLPITSILEKESLE